jgi:hypothetical protein
MQDWKSYEGWSPLTKQPGNEGARHSVILSLLVDHSLFMHPDQQRQLKNNLPAYTVGSLRANVQVECLLEVIDDVVSSDNPQEKLKRFTQALHEVFAFGHSKKHMVQRQLGRLEPTPFLKYRADEVMRNMPLLIGKYLSSFPILVSFSKFRIISEFKDWFESESRAPGALITSGMSTLSVYSQIVDERFKGPTQPGSLAMA